MNKAAQFCGGLYRPEFEKDSCGFGLMAQMDGTASHWLVQTSIDALGRMTHRGAVAADGKSGDGCGLLLRKPDSFLRAIAKESGWDVAENYAVGMVFLSTDNKQAAVARDTLSKALTDQGLDVSGWRVVPTDSSACGEEALASMPVIEQVFVNAPADMKEEIFERRLFIARRVTEKVLTGKDDVFYVPSLSARVISIKAW